MRKIIVAGAGGYVGRQLVKFLEGEVKVTGIDVAAGYVRPDQIGELSGPYDVFYNFAWVGKGGPLRADYNIQMQNVKVALDFYKEAVRLGCKRYICAGTIGELMVELPECAKIRSQNFVYVNSKNYLHRVLNSIEQPERCKVIWARLGNLYGGGSSGGNLVEYTIGRLVKGEVAIFGPAEQPYDFIHVSDCVRALAAIGLSERVVSDEFYVGAGDIRPLKDYLLAIGKIMGKSELVRIGGRPDDGTRYQLNWFRIEKLTKETGYLPNIRFEDGVRRTLGE